MKECQEVSGYHEISQEAGQTLVESPCCRVEAVLWVFFSPGDQLSGQTCRCDPTSYHILLSVPCHQQDIVAVTLSGFSDQGGKGKAASALPLGKLADC